MGRKLSIRTWLSLATVVLLVAVVYFSRNEIMQAWSLIEQVDIGLLLAAIIPLQVLSYIATGESMNSYLRSQGLAKGIKHGSLARLAVEMNFVNHVFPSAGVSGMSYTAWRMKHMGVSYADSTTSQLVRLFAMIAGFVIILFVSVFWMLLDGSLNRGVTMVAALLVFGMVLFVAGMGYALDRERRVVKIAGILSGFSNRVVYLATLGRKVDYFSRVSFERFLIKVGVGYQQVRRDRRVLIVPLFWGVVFSVCEVAMFYVAFVALGEPVNPAALAIAHALASTAGLIMITPGGAGLYEAIMVGFLSLIGVNPQLGIAGIVLARVLLVGGAVVMGYPFYQLAVLKHGSRPKTHTEL